MWLHDALINPLKPNISMHVLHIVFYRFPMGEFV